MPPIDARSGVRPVPRTDWVGLLAVAVIGAIFLSIQFA